MLVALLSSSPLCHLSWRHGRKQNFCHSVISSEYRSISAYNLNSTFAKRRWFHKRPLAHSIDRGMAVADKEDIDFTELEKELEAAIDQDSRYWLQNDAKIRAVNQRVATYDEFRDIVKAAHLKPLKKKDIVGSSDTSSSRGGFVWNSIASGKKKTSSDRLEKHDMENDVYPRSASHQLDLQRALSSTSEFMQMWRSLDDSERRYAVLQHIGTGALGRLFSTTEIPVGLLGEILEAALHFRASTNEICFVVKMLETLTKAKRFCLTLEFLSSGEKATCKQLLSKLNSSLQGQQQDLAERGVTEWTLRQLHNAYRV